NMAWTEQQIETLKKMWGNGYSANDIAKNLGGGVTRNAVIGKAHRLKLSAGAASSRSNVEPPSKTKGVVMATINKVSKRRSSVLRSMPPVQSSDMPARTTILRETKLRPIETARRSEGIPVTKAGEHHCRWPIGDPRSPDFRFCGCETQEGLPYCAHHARIAYQTVSRRSRANANADAAVTQDAKTRQFEE
ncbi:MAG: GcrA family cell cycle regulator, partial [Bdellovibrionales bacterium]